MRTKKTFMKLLAAALAVTFLLQPALLQTAVHAAVVDYGNGIRFDADYYAGTYPDAKALCGNDENALLDHYLTVGIPEGRRAYENQDPQETENLKLVFASLLSSNIPAAGTARTEEAPSQSTEAGSVPAAEVPGDSAAAVTVTAPAAAVAVTVPAPAPEAIAQTPAGSMIPQTVQVPETPAFGTAPETAVVPQSTEAGSVPAAEVPGDSAAVTAATAPEAVALLPGSAMAQDTVPPDRLVLPGGGSASENALELSGIPAPQNPAPAAALPLPGQVQTSNGLVMVYLNGTNLETGSGSATNLVNQAINASKAGNTRFVIMAGGTKTWKHPAMQNANNGNTVSYVIENGTIRELKQYGSGKAFLSPEMITTFINDTKAAYASEHTSLVFWDHGGGAAGGYGSDELTNKAMSASAVAAGVKNSGAVFEAIGFDTCLMGSLEVASNFSGTAKYFLGSQELESGYGWNFDSFSTYGTTDFVTFGKKLIDDYDAYTKLNDRQAAKRTLALYDLNNVQIAQNQWNDLVAKLGSTKEGVEMMAVAREFSREFSYSSTADNRDGEIDLISFLNALAYTSVSAESEAMLGTLQNTVLYKNANEMDEVNGISVYLPGENVYQFNKRYDDIKGNNISEEAMKVYGKLASVYAGQRETVLFQQTSYDQKHDDFGPEHYQKAKWYDKEFASIGTGTTCYYKDVQNGGFAIESETGLTPDMIDTAELRVMLKHNEYGYVSLGRTSTFCTTATKTSPVYNFNGQWLHINGQPVAAYQYDDFNSNAKKHMLGIYTIARVNGKDSKIDLQWNATDKTWGCYGYIDMNSQMSTKTRSTPFREGDTVQFIYDVTKSGSSDLKMARLFEPITYTKSGFKLETRPIDQSKNDVLFYGTITDTYGKTVATPYFKLDPNSSKVTEERIKGAEPEIRPAVNDRSAGEKWVLKDGGEDSFLSCYYDPVTGTYESYSEDTDAYDMDFETEYDEEYAGDTEDIVHYNDVLQAGFYYDASEDLYYFLDADGIIEEVGGVDEATFASFFGLNAEDYEDFDAVIASFYEYDEDEASTEAGSDLLETQSYADPGSEGQNGGSYEEYSPDSYAEDDYDYDDYDDDYDDDDYDDDDYDDDDYDDNGSGVYYDEG